MASMALRAELSRRIRGLSPADWREFSELWTAFNAIYGGEPDRRERARVMRCLRESFSAAAALRVLRATTPSITRILDIPPGDMRRDRTDPNFRAASQKYAAVYRTPKESSAARLAAVGAILYQVREPRTRRRIWSMSGWSFGDHTRNARTAQDPVRPPGPRPEPGAGSRPLRRLLRDRNRSTACRPTGARRRRPATGPGPRRPAWW